MRGQGAEGQPCTSQVIHQLLGTGQIEAQGVGQPVERGLQVTGRGAQQVIELPLQACHGKRQFIAATGGFTKPERNGRRLTLCVLDPDLAGFHPQDSIRSVA
ncbi:hypothetical protein D3C73_1415490 [compost metagenome]